MFRKTIKYAAIGYAGTFATIKGFGMIDRTSTFSQTLVPYFTIAEGFVIRAPRTFGTFLFVYLKHMAYKKYFEISQEAPQVKESMKLIHVVNATTLLNMCIHNGGVWIKLGQAMANMRGFLPDEYCEVLKKSFDLVPHVDFSEISELFVQDFGKPVSELFKTFDITPVAAASLAQVHRATMLNGQEVAVKVQYPNVKYYYRLDLKISEIMRRISFAAQNQEMRTDINELVGKNFENELNFTQEAKNTMRARKDFESIGDDVYVPFIVPTLSSPRILTMEYIHGFKGNDVNGMKADGIDISIVATQLFTGIANQIFKFSFVHADPHAGNFMVRRNPNYKFKPQVVLLDHGLYNELTDEFRLGYASFWNALVMNDDARMKAYCDSIGISNWKNYSMMIKMVSMDSLGPRADYKHYKKGEQMTGEKHEKMVGHRTAEMQNILQNIPKEMILLMRTNFLLRGVNQTFGVPVNRFNIFARVATYEYNKSRLSKGLWGSTIAFKDSILFEIGLIFMQIYTFFMGLIWNAFFAGQINPNM